MSLDFTLCSDYCDKCGRYDAEESFNITHNLGAMWLAAKCFDALYESHGKRAKDVLLDLKLAYARLVSAPSEFRGFDSPNGWGTYEHAVPWLARVIEACEQYPEAIINISR